MVNEYISKIGNVVDKVKNATFEVKINDIKIIGNNNDIAVIMKVQDKTGTIKALLVGEREELIDIMNNLKTGNEYRIRGNISILDDELISGKTLVIKAIEQI